MGEAAKAGHIQVLGVQPDIKELIREENRTGSPVGQLVSRVSLIFAVKEQNPLLG